MSKRVEKLIAQENAEILRKLTEDEAIFVEAYYYLDKDGKRVYDVDLIEQEFWDNLETLIALNKQKGLSYGEMHDGRG
ncbi:MAG: hypothetical protein CME70_05780 [Halobacteriovorax sp.]|nr:hypothetical protein [Halobacteriovorax sp.]|tara:strand:- start:280 stop:513 length:234 start_codon:yes stop_codon:yes gene_type:complete